MIQEPKTGAPTPTPARAGTVSRSHLEKRPDLGVLGVSLSSGKMMGGGETWGIIGVLWGEGYFVPLNYDSRLCHTKDEAAKEMFVLTLDGHSCVHHVVVGVFLFKGLNCEIFRFQWGFHCNQPGHWAGSCPNKAVGSCVESHRMAMGFTHDFQNLAVLTMKWIRNVDIRISTICIYYILHIIYND